MPDLSTLFSGHNFIPHGHCYLWQPTLVWLHLVSDSAIALAYYSIPVALVYFTRQRHDLPFRWVFWLFGAFIIACGTTHLLDVWTLWHPTYWLSGGVKLLTAVLSVATASTLFRRLPQALSLPSTAQWQSANSRLQVEAVAHAQTEADLRVDQARLQVAERMAGLGNWDYDLRTQTMTWSESLFRLFGLPLASAAPSYQEQLQWFQPESRLQLDQATQTASRHGTPYALELQLARPDGDVSWLLARGEAVQDAVGTVVKLVGTSLDITESKQLEVALQALNQLKDDFLSTVSHELRTPLTSIKLAAHMLAISFKQCQPSLTTVFGDPLAAKMSRYLAILQTECDRELCLINELLELQSLESGAALPEWSTLYLLDLLHELMSVYQERAVSRDASLCLKVPEILPNLVSDVTLLTSVLQELLTNACKYTPPGGTIVVSVIPDPIGSTLQLTVGNTGTGTAIAPEVLSQLFNKFYRAPGGDPWRQGGTGLGLALAQRQVARLGGTLTVTSDDNQTVFSVELPLRPTL